MTKFPRHPGPRDPVLIQKYIKTVDDIVNHIKAEADKLFPEMYPGVDSERLKVVFATSLMMDVTLEMEKKFK